MIVELPHLNGKCCINEVLLMEVSERERERERERRGREREGGGRRDKEKRGKRGKAEAMIEGRERKAKR